MESIRKNTDGSAQVFGGPVRGDAGGVVEAMGAHTGRNAVVGVGEVRGSPPVLVADLASVNRVKSLPKRSLVALDFERMNIPEEFWRVKISECGGRGRQSLALRYLQYIDAFYAPPSDPTKRHECLGLYLFGDAGVGKTGFAVIAAKGARLAGRSVYFISAFELREAARLRTTFEEEQTTLERARDVDLLVLDGLSESDLSDTLYGSKFFEELITLRRSRNKLTVVTSRISLVDLRDGYRGVGEVVVNKLCPVEMVGVNRNLAAQAQATKVVLGVKPFGSCSGTFYEP